MNFWKPLYFDISALNGSWLQKCLLWHFWETLEMFLSEEIVNTKLINKERAISWKITYKVWLQVPAKSIPISKMIWYAIILILVLYLNVSTYQIFNKNYFDTQGYLNFLKVGQSSPQILEIFESGGWGELPPKARSVFVDTAKWPEKEAQRDHEAAEKFICVM